MRILRWGPFGRTARERALDEELRFHLERQIEENRRSGMDPAAARAAALRSFGGVELTKDRVRDGWSGRLLDDLGRDLRLALRGMRRAPGFTAAAVVTVAVGVGACAAIVSVVSHVLLRPPPVPAPEQVMVLRQTPPGGAAPVAVSFAAYDDWRREATCFQGLGAILRVSFTLGGAEPIHLAGARVTASALGILDVRPAVGRLFTASDEGDAAVAVLAHRFWQGRLGGRQDVLGTHLTVEGRAVTVVGVLPRGSALDADGELFVPLGFSPSERTNHQAHWLSVIGRLRPGVDPAQARGEMTALAERLSRRGPARGWGVALIPLRQALVGEVRPVLLSLLGAVACLLLIACANVAHLLLARGASRSRQMAVRAALGATRGRIARQVLMESLALALLGGAAGLALAHAGLAALLALAPDALPQARDIAVEGRVLGPTFALALLCAAGAGLAPTLQATRVPPGRVLGTGRGVRPGGFGVRGALVVAEVAVALVLLTGAGLLMRGFLRLHGADPGFQPDGALVTTVTLPRTRAPSAEAALAFARQALDRIAALPGVTAVAAATSMPFAEPATRTVQVAGRPASADLVADLQIVSDDYFQAMRIPLRRGRPFARDGAGRPAAIVSAAAARQWFGAADPVGQQIAVAASPLVWREIIAVAGDVATGSRAPAPARIYLPFAQAPSRAFTLVVRSSEPASLRPAVRRTIAALDAQQATDDLRPLSDLVADSIARQRLAMLLFAVFSAAALLLAAVGIHGVMAFAVTQRAAEIAIRMALGAHPSQILRMVLGQAARLVALGTLLGLAGAFVLTRLLPAELAAAPDPLTVAAVVALLFAVALLASLPPAHHATHCPPTSTLRE
jgi:putative ABC transport system permease protein